MTGANIFFCMISDVDSYEDGDGPSLIRDTLSRYLIRFTISDFSTNIFYIVYFTEVKFR